MSASTSLGSGHLYRFPRQEASWFQESPQLSWGNGRTSSKVIVWEPSLGKLVPQPMVPPMSLFSMPSSLVFVNGQSQTHLQEDHLVHSGYPRTQNTPDLPCLYHETLPYRNRHLSQSRISDFSLGNLKLGADTKPGSHHNCVAPLATV